MTRSIDNAIRIDTNCQCCSRNASWSFLRLPSLVTSIVITLTLTNCATGPSVVPPAALTSQQKIAAIIVLEHDRVLLPAPESLFDYTGREPANRDAAPMPSLIELLHDTDPRVRRRAALAVGRVRLIAGGLPLRDALTDPNPDVRQMSAFALGLLADPEAKESLMLALNDVDPLTRGRSAEALARLDAHEAAPAIGAMVQAVTTQASQVPQDDLTYPQSPEVEAFRMGVTALALLDAYEPLAMAVLSPAGELVVRWWPVAWALQYLADSRSYDPLRQFVQGQGSYAVAFAARGLGALEDGRTVEFLLPLLDPSRYDSHVIVSAVRALTRLTDPRIESALMDLMRDPDIDPLVQLEILVAFGERRAANAVDLFLDVLTHPSPSMRIAALRGLASLDEQRFMLALSGLDEDVHWSVRAALADILKSMTPDVAIPRLQVMLNDTDRRVIPSLLSSLVALRVPEVGSTIREMLKDDDVIIRSVAADQMGILKLQGGVPLLAAAYLASLGEDFSIVRISIVDALAEYGGSEAVAALQTALTDDDWRVRVTAASRLLVLDPGTAYRDQVGPAGEVTIEEAISLSDPVVSPHVYFETDKGTIQIELAVLDAPVSTERFATLAAEGYFDGLPFHEIVAARFLRGGDPRGDGRGGHILTLPDEIGPNRFLRGTVGVAADTAESGAGQFFVSLAPQPLIDAERTVLGRVVDGMEVVDRLLQWDLVRSTRVWDGISMTGR